MSLMDVRARPGSVRVAPARADAVSFEIAPQPGFWAAKRAFDVVLSVLLLPLLFSVGAALLVLNPFLNRGPLLFAQRRMGLRGRPFVAYKFRTMREANGPARAATHGVEVDRITRLGAHLRRLRVDELPQIVNVLRGEMSLVGPRPDVYEHARVFAEIIPGYRARHAVRPGISGLAQVMQGYAEGMEMTARKTRYDLAYIRRAGWRLEAFVVVRTIAVVISGFGAR